MNNQLLFNRGNYRISLEKGVQKDIVDLLKNTIWGTKGGVLYRHLDTPIRIYEIDSPYFLTLRKEEKLISTLALCVKKMPIYNALYIRYFSFEQGFQINQPNQKKTGNSNSIFHKTIQSFFSNPIPFQGKNVFFAFVELENERSLQLCNRMGFETISNLKTLIFSRFSPKLSIDFFRIKENEKKEVLNEITAFYKDYSCTSFENIFKNDDFFVLKKEGRIVAGVQAHKVNWVMEEIPDFMGKVIKYIVPYTPFLARLINPNQYQFLAFEGLFFEKEELIEELLESVCAKLSVYSGIIWTDEKSHLYSIVKKCSLGFLNKLNDDVSADIITKFVDFSAKEKTDFSKKPVYISSFDLV